MVSLNPSKFYSTPSKLYREVEQSMDRCHKYLSIFEKQLRRYHSRHYDGKEAEGHGEDFLENHYHDWISYIVPRTAMENPKTKVGTKRPAGQADAARALHLGLARWVKDAKLRERLVAPLVDMQFNRGVLQVAQDPIAGMDPIVGLNPDDPEDETVPHAPVLNRIPQDTFFEDAVARQREQLRFQGHIGHRDKQDLLDEAKKRPELGWNADLIENMSTKDTSSKLKRDPEAETTRREEVSWYELWVPELELDAYPNGEPAPADGWRKHGYNGAILTIPTEAPSTDSPADWLREPRPYYGPPCGPYEVFGVYELPNRTQHLAPLVVNEEQIVDLNKHARSQSDSAADYKRIMVVDRTSPRIVGIIKSTEHHNVAAIPGFKKEGIAQVELGGITDQQIAYTGIARERLNRNAHMDDARRGEVTPGQTATGIAEAAIAGDVRVGWVEERFYRSVTNVLKKVLWYLYMDNRVAFPIGDEANEEFETAETTEGGEVALPTDVWYVGGAESGMPFEALELEVETYSMQRMDDTQRRQSIENAMNQSFGLLPLIVQFPKGVDWKMVFNDVGEMNQMPDWGKRFDVDELLQQAQTLDPRLTEPVLAAQAGAGKMHTFPGVSGQLGGAQGGQGGQAQPTLGGQGQNTPQMAGAPAVPGGPGTSGGMMGAMAKKTAGVA